MGDKKRTAIRFGLTMAVYFAIFSTFSSFMVAYGMERGFSSTVCSWMVAVYQTAAFGGQFLWGAVCDKLRTNRKVFLFGTAAAGALQIILYFTANPFLFAVIYGLFGLMMAPMGSILDTWMLRGIDYDFALYGKLRSVGTVGYAVFILFMGAAIERFGYGFAITASTLTVLATLILAFPLADAVVPAKSKGVSLKDIGSIAKVGPFMLLITVLFLIGLAAAPLGNLKIMVLTAVGGGVALQGVDNFIGCVSQFLAFYYGKVFDRFSGKAMLLLGTGLTLIGIGIAFMATTPWMIFVSSFFLFGTYGISTPASRKIIRDCIRPELQTTAISVADACYNNLSGTCALLYAGALAGMAGVRVMILVHLIIALIPFAIMLVVTGKRGKAVSKLA